MKQKSQRRKCKNNKASICFKGFASSYNDEILNYINLELQFKDTESAIKNKLIDLLTQLRF